MRSIVGLARRSVIQQITHSRHVSKGRVLTNVLGAMGIATETPAMGVRQAPKTISTIVVRAEPLVHRWRGRQSNALEGLVSFSVLRTNKTATKICRTVVRSTPATTQTTVVHAVRLATVVNVFRGRANVQGQAQRLKLSH